MSRRSIVATLLFLSCALCTGPALSQSVNFLWRIKSFNCHTLRLAIDDLTQTHGDDYAAGPKLLAELTELEQQARQAISAADGETPWPQQRLQDLSRKLYSLKWRAMLSNPAVQSLEVLCVKRGWNDKITPGELKSLGIASNHECHSSLWPTGYVNEIAVFRAADPRASWKTLYRPEDKGWVGDLDLHWNADRILFSKADKTQWSLWEMNIDGSGMRRITQTPPDVDCFDPCYLPDGRILCASNATEPMRSLLARHGSKRRGQPVRHERRRLGHAACHFRPGSQHAPGRARQRARHLQPLGLHRHQPRLPAAADGDESRRHRSACRLRFQFLVSQRPLLATLAARQERPTAQHSVRLPRARSDRAPGACSTSTKARGKRRASSNASPGEVCRLR